MSLKKVKRQGGGMNKIINRPLRSFKIILAVIGLYFLYALFFVSSAFSEDKDVGLRLRSDGANVSIAACSDECPVVSPLRIRNKGHVESIKLVSTGDAAATKMRVKTRTGIMAAKRLNPIAGRFIREVAGGPGYGTWGNKSHRWIASITCACADGTTRTLGVLSDGRAYPGHLRELVTNAIRNKKLAVRPPTDECLLGATGGTGGIFTWNNDATPHLPTLRATCEILGYDRYVSFTSVDDQRGRQYPNGKCNFDSASDNYLWRYEP